MSRWWDQHTQWDHEVETNNMCEKQIYILNVHSKTLARYSVKWGHYILNVTHCLTLNMHGTIAIHDNMLNFDTHRQVLSLWIFMKIVLHVVTRWLIMKSQVQWLRLCLTKKKAINNENNAEEKHYKLRKFCEILATLYSLIYGLLNTAISIWEYITNNRLDTICICTVLEFACITEDS